MTDTLRFLMVVNDPAVARHAADNGVDTLFVDLERIGKALRQPRPESWKSSQQAEDITRIRQAAPNAELLVRLNPLHDGTAGEVEDAVARGADCLMLPMFRRADELARFQDLVRGRAQVVALFETIESLAEVEQIVAQGPPERAHFGLNDLHLALGQRFMFEPLAAGLIDPPAAILRAAGVPFGVGGVARMGEGSLDPGLLVGEHVRLGSNWAILSRTFHRQSETLDAFVASTDLARELALLREAYSRFANADAHVLAANQAAVRRAVETAVAGLAVP